MMDWNVGGVFVHVSRKIPSRKWPKRGGSVSRPRTIGSGLKPSENWPLIAARVVNIYDELAGQLDTQRAART